MIHKGERSDNLAVQIEDGGRRCCQHIAFEDVSQIAGRIELALGDLRCLVPELRNHVAPCIEGRLDLSLFGARS